MKSNYHVYNQSFLTPLLQGFSKSGANVYDTSNKSLIKKVDFEREGTYIPMSVLYEFLINLSEDHGINNLANEFYLKMNFADLEQIKVAIGYDCRNNSRLFSETSAKIFAANGIKAYLG